MTQWPVMLDHAVRDRLVERVVSQRARIQLVTGPSGIGKSTLTASVTAQLEAMGFTALPVVGMPELKEISLGAMAPLLASTDAPPLEPTSDRLQRLFSLVSKASAQQVLVVDDGPMLDVVSASTVYQLVRVYGMRCVMTARSEHPIAGPLLRLREEGFMEVTEMEGLTWPVASSIVQKALGGTVEPESLREITALAGGNPLFLRGLVLAAAQIDAVSPGENGLVIDTGLLPRRLWDTIAMRFDGLRPEDRALADLIATAEPWPESLLAAPESIARLEQASLVSRAADGEVYLAHPLFAETIASLMSEDERDGWRIEAARRFLGAEREDLRFKAMCLLSDSSQPPIPEDLTWAAAYAHTLDDHALAIRLAALAITRSLADGSVALFQAHLIHANALSASGRLSEADDAFDVAVAAATDDEERSSIATRRGFHLAIRHQRAQEAVRLGELALERIEDPAARAFLIANIAKWQLMTGQKPTVAPSSAAESSDAATALNEVLYRLTVAVFSGDLGVIRSLITAARPLTAAAHSVIRHGDEMVDFAEFLVMVLEGRPQDARLFGERRRGEVLAESAGMWSYGLALVALHEGRAEQALELASSAVELLAWRDFLGVLGTAVALRATAAALLGRPRQATEFLDTIEPSARSYITTRLQASEAEAWNAWARGDAPTAVAEITQAVLPAVEAGYFAFASMTAHVAVRMGYAGEVLDPLRECAAVANGELVAAILAHAEAVAAANVDGLFRAAESLAQVGLTAGAADAARQSATVARRKGDDRAANRASRFASALDPSSPGLTGHREEERALVLSAREWDVATAAARRERNREIAERLGISVRTVENHLRNVFRKLGVSSRDELAEELALLDAP